MTTPGIAQDWLDTAAYPFDHHFMDAPQGKMHYIDEGQGPVILFVHGTPTWSFLYRDFIKQLSGDFRCIAVDHVGFGLSKGKNQPVLNPQQHAGNLQFLIRKLDLNKITLVVHDFGGPIGLGAALETPDRIDKVVIFNTWLWGIKDRKDVQKIDKLVNSWIGKQLYLTFNISPKLLLKQGFDEKNRLTKAIHQQYISPFPDKESRKPLLKIAQSLAGSSDWYDQLWKKINLLEKKNWLILWGMKDSFIDSSFLEKWKDQLPDAVIKTYECGHFVQEEQTLDTITEIRDFMNVKY
jgi:haloalkane dehalogenase